MLSRLKSSVFLPTVGSLYSKLVRTPAPTEIGGSATSSAPARAAGASKTMYPTQAAARQRNSPVTGGTEHKAGANRAAPGAKWCDLIVCLLPGGSTPVCHHARGVPPPAVRAD